MKYIVLISLYLLSCTSVYKENNSKIVKDSDEVYIINDKDISKFHKKVEIISVVDNDLKNVLERIIKKKDKDCKNTIRYIEARGNYMVMSEYFLKFLLNNNKYDNYIIIIDDQGIIVQTKKLNKKLFKKLGFYVDISYPSVQEYEIGDIYDFSYWYIKDGKIVKEQINNVSCDN